MTPLSENHILQIPQGSHSFTDKKKFHLFKIENSLTEVYCVALKQPIGSSLVVTHRTADVRVTSDRPGTLGLVPVEISTILSGSHAPTCVLNTHVS